MAKRQEKKHNSNTYLVKTSYLGSAYSGMQRQSKNPNTIQQKIEETLAQVLGQKKIGIIISSRTDTGVHALCQYFKFTLPSPYDTDEFKIILNHNLPQDIRIHSLTLVDKKFNLQNNIKNKTYRYYFSHDITPSAFQAHITYPSLKKLNIKEMTKAAKLFKGEHDLKHFCVNGARTPNTTRVIKKCHIQEDPVHSGIYFLEISASGFLKYMVRFIMGALLKIGEGHFDKTVLKDCLARTKRQPFPYKAPPIGLQLFHIEFISEKNIFSMRN